MADWAQTWARADRPLPELPLPEDRRVWYERQKRDRLRVAWAQALALAEVSPAGLELVGSLVHRWHQADDRCTRAEAEAQRERSRQAGLAASEARRDALTAEFAERYNALGPQYAVLVPRIAALAASLEQLEQDPLAATRTEWLTLTKRLEGLVAGVQRYTESQKTEVLVKAQIENALIGLLQIVEREMLDQPQRWLRITEAVEAHAPALRSGERLDGTFEHYMDAP